MTQPSRRDTMTDANHRRYRYVWAAFLRLILSLHVFYLYASSHQSDTLTPWGTFVEATLDPISVLPYTSDDDTNKVYQNMLFKACLTPVFSGANVSFWSDLCTVETQDHKTFNVTVPPAHQRSDLEPITIEDVYFTYQNILKDNARNQEALASYKSIGIDINESELIFTFPNASIDNRLFFTNFILPEHILANRDYEFYTTTYLQQPVHSECASLQTGKNDETSAVFDLWWCSDSTLRYYQVKYFDSLKSVGEYIKNNDNLDLITTDASLPDYEEVQYVANKFVSVFMNTERPQLIQWLRKQLASYMVETMSWAANNALIPDQFLFPVSHTTSLDVLTSLLSWATAPLWPTSLGSWDIQPELVAQAVDSISTQSVVDTAESGDPWAPWSQAPQAPIILPTALDFSRDIAAHSQRSFYKPTEIQNTYPIDLTFAQRYDKVWVLHNGILEYFPRSFDIDAQTATYILNPAYRNVLTGTNTYTIQWYINDTVKDTYTLVIDYITEPTDLGDTTPEQEQTQEDSADTSDTDSITWAVNTWTVETEIVGTGTVSTGDVLVPTKDIAPPAPRQPLTFIYFQNDLNTSLIAHLRRQLEDDGLAEYITFEWYTQSAELEGKLEWGDYDIALRVINMWLRKDLSNLFISEKSNINPSNFTSEPLASNLWRYFISRADQKPAIQEWIQNIYNKSYPLVILGKQHETYQLSSSWKESPFPYRQYVFGWRKKAIKSIDKFAQATINRDNVFTWSNFVQFVKEKASGA